MKRLAALTGGGLLMGIAVLIGFRAIRSDVDSIRGPGGRFRKLDERIERGMPNRGSRSQSPQLELPATEPTVVVELRSGPNATDFVVSVAGHDFTLAPGQDAKQEEELTALSEAMAREARLQGAARLELRTLRGSQESVRAEQTTAVLQLVIDAAMAAGLKDVVMASGSKPTPRPEAEGDAMR